MPRKTGQGPSPERARDNQRRSRARRRAHLLDLEDRNRRYEIDGIEASADVKESSERVAEENRQLRALLGRYGVSSDNIQAYLNAISSSAPEQHSEAVRRLVQAIASQTSGARY